VVKKTSGTRNPNPAPVTEQETVTQQRPAHIDNGNEARGSVNSRNNQTRTQPEPSAAVMAMGDQPISENVVSLRQRGPLAARRALLSETGQAKHAILTNTKQRLSQAADLYSEGGAKAKEGQEIAEVCAVDLFKARADGILSADELSTILGDSFGWKVKANKGDPNTPVKGGDPNASKTPFGPGEAIRKRVVRAVQAHEYVTGTDASKFFDGLPTDKVQDILDRTRNGQLSIWSAYDYMGDIKRENVTRVNPAFDPKAVAKFVEALREKGAAAQFVANPDLQDAYLALYDMIVEIDREAGQLQAQAKKAAASA
jgi:hypothetical protein